MKIRSSYSENLKFPSMYDNLVYANHNDIQNLLAYFNKIIKNCHLKYYYNSKLIPPVLLQSFYHLYCNTKQECLLYINIVIIFVLYSLQKIISDSMLRRIDGESYSTINHINYIERKIAVRDRAADKCQFNAPVRIASRKGPKNKTTFVSWLRPRVAASSFSRGVV